MRIDIEPGLSIVGVAKSDFDISVIKLYGNKGKATLTFVCREKLNYTLCKQ